MNKKTIVIDIDGCLNMYPIPLQMWAEVVLSLDSKSSKEAIKRENDFDYVKETYRHSALLKYFLPCNGVCSTVSSFKEAGYRIVLLSARNPSKNPKILEITETWLKKYNIPFDSVVFTKDKAAYIKEYESEILLAVEDEPQILEVFNNLETEIVLFKNDLNSHFERPHFHMVYSWEEIASLFKKLTTT